MPTPGWFGDPGRERGPAAGPGSEHHATRRKEPASPDVSEQHEEWHAGPVAAPKPPNRRTVESCDNVPP